MNEGYGYDPNNPNKFLIDPADYPHIRHIVCHDCYFNVCTYRIWYPTNQMIENTDLFKQI